MTIEKFEDVIAWQRARELTREIYCVTRQGFNFNFPDGRSFSFL